MSLPTLSLLSTVRRPWVCTGTQPATPCTSALQHLMMLCGQVASAVARTFDVHGWFSPATVTIKILLQKVWQAHINRDDPIPEELLMTWTFWREQLSSLTNHQIPTVSSNRPSATCSRLWQSNVSASAARQRHHFCSSNDFLDSLVSLYLDWTSAVHSFSLIINYSRLQPRTWIFRWTLVRLICSPGVVESVIVLLDSFRCQSHGRSLQSHPCRSVEVCGNSSNYIQLTMLLEDSFHKN